MLACVVHGAAENMSKSPCDKSKEYCLGLVTEQTTYIRSSMLNESETYVLYKLFKPCSTVSNQCL